MDKYTAAECAYSKGYDDAAKQIFEDLGDLLDAKFLDSSGSYDGTLGTAVHNLKKKYGVN